MNRDQWHRKMRRRIELFSYTGSSLEDTVKIPKPEKCDARESQPLVTVEQEQALVSPPAGSKTPEFVLSQADKYGACCEWDLPLNSKKR